MRRIFLALRLTVFLSAIVLGLLIGACGNSEGSKPKPLKVLEGTAIGVSGDWVYVQHCDGHIAFTDYRGITIVPCPEGAPR